MSITLSERRIIRAAMLGSTLAAQQEDGREEIETQVREALAEMRLCDLITDVIAEYVDWSRREVRQEARRVVRALKDGRPHQWEEELAGIL